MFRNLAVKGSLAAATAVACMLSLMPDARASGGVPSGLLLDRPRCCGPAAGEGIGPGAVDPAAGMGPGNRAAGPGVAAGPLLLAQAADQGDAEPDTGPESGNDAATPPATELPPGGETVPGNAQTDRDRFQGSPKPAGPDLTVTEERDLISRGWD